LKESLLFESSVTVNRNGRILADHRVMVVGNVDNHHLCGKVMSKADATGVNTVVLQFQETPLP